MFADEPEGKEEDEEAKLNAAVRYVLSTFTLKHLGFVSTYK